MKDIFGKYEITLTKEWLYKLIDILYFYYNLLGGSCYLTVFTYRMIQGQTSAKNSGRLRDFRFSNPHSPTQNLIAHSSFAKSCSPTVDLS